MNYIVQYYNKIFYFLIGLTFVLLFISIIISNKEDEHFIEDQMKFNYVFEYTENEQIERGLELINDLEEQYKKNYVIAWKKGWILSQTGDLEEALDYYLSAQGLNPVLTREPIFLIQFSWVMLNLGYYEEAKIYLEHSKEQEGITEEQIHLVDELLYDVHINLNNT